MLLRASDIRKPRPGIVDPNACPVCAELRKELSSVLTARHRPGLIRVLEDMRAHKVYGHPQDTRPIGKGNQC